MFFSKNFGYFLQKYRDYCALFKINLVLMVVSTTVLGYIVSIIPQDTLDLMTILHLTLGVLMAGSSAHVFNQIIEKNNDALMLRTKRRPIPSGKITLRNALVVGGILIISALIYLNSFTSHLTTAITALTFLGYVALYTPLKQITIWNTWIGAFIGALPVLIGWSAAPGAMFGPQIFFLFSILFLWQVPHFLSLAWKYKREYEKAHFTMLPQRDSSGKLTAISVLSHSVLIVLMVIGYCISADVSHFFLVLALVISLWFFWHNLTFFQTKNDVSAQKVFIASIIYMPLFSMIAAADKLI